VIEGRQQGNCLPSGDIDQRHHAGVHTDQIVEPSRRQKLRGRSEDRRWRGVEDRQIEGENVSRGQAHQPG
jgi:hypothetical protein